MKPSSSSVKREETRTVGKPNPFMEEAKKLSLVRLTDIWKIGFQRVKSKKLLGDDILRFKAVCSVLTFHHGADLPKVKI